jgi:hypothetical protein
MELKQVFPGEGRGPAAQAAGWVPAFAGKRFHLRDRLQGESTSSGRTPPPSPGKAGEGLLRLRR